MAGAFNLDDYKCTSLPPNLWRVIHPQSQSTTDRATGDLLAADRTRIILDEPRLKEAVVKHWKWGNRDATCFLSVFSDKKHALNWATQRAEELVDFWDWTEDEARESVDISEIDTANLPADTYVFDAQSLKTKWDIDYEYYEDELLFLHRIPCRSITSTRTLKEIRAAESSQKNAATKPNLVYAPKCSFASPEFIEQILRSGIRFTQYIMKPTSRPDWYVLGDSFVSSGASDGSEENALADPNNALM